MNDTRTLTADYGGRAEVHAHGAHVTRWNDVLWLSPRARFEPGEAIRGGIPIIFPQFADLGPLPKHGFARTAAWAWAESDESTCVLRLEDSPETRAVWDHAFRAEVRVAVGGTALEVALSVRNTGEAPFDFTAALHTYFRVGDVRRATVRWLDGVAYRDKVAGHDATQSGDVTFTGETDRVYFGAPDVLRIDDGAEGRTIAIHTRGFPDAVVWNPWEKAAAMDDVGEDQITRFVCVEAAAVGAPVTLAPEAEWTGSQRIVVERRGG